MNKLHCLIVDDEPLAREGLAGYVQRVDFLQLADVVENALSLPKIIAEKQIDLLFLDIQMPYISGIDFLKATRQQPMVILTTAHADYAVEGFQLNVLDYLLKPITFERFFMAAVKAKDYHALSTGPGGGPGFGQATYFFVRCGNKYEKIVLADLLYVEGMQNYVTIFTTTAKYITLLSLTQLEENLKGLPFLRVHKSFIVSLAYIDRIEGNEISIQQARVPIGKTYRDNVIAEVEKRLWENK